MSMRRLLLGASLCLLLTSCSNIAYYAQAIEGQVRLMVAARPIADVVSDAATDPGLRQKLEQASALRNFASRELALPDNGSYRAYADLGRPYVVWNVFAAAELSVEPRQWCLVFIGCINYRGYYDKNDAERYADQLKQTGADTYVGGVPAYSTLGYFDDPVLNTFLRLGDNEIARIIFHELAHQLIYAQGDSAFNESFAATVETEGMRRWLMHSGTPAQRRDFETQQERKTEFHRLIADTRDRLRTLYGSSQAPNEKRLGKAETFAEMRRAYADLKLKWAGYGGYDPWFSQPLNNAVLGSVTLYTQWVPAFQSMLEQEGGNLPCFYQRVALLSHLPKTARAAALDELLAKPIIPSLQNHFLRPPFL